MDIGKHYNLSLYSNPVLPNSFRNAKVISILDYETSLKFSNIELTQRQIFPYLPPGTSNNHNNYTYYYISVNDKKYVVAAEWIIQDSIELTTGVSYTIRLNNITPTQLALVRDQLRLLGLSFDIL